MKRGTLASYKVHRLVSDEQLMELLMIIGSIAVAMDASDNEFISVNERLRCL